MTLECEHGQLARACTVCYLEREIEGHEAVLRQALVALEAMNPYPASKEDQRAAAITALRARLGEKT